MAGFRPPDREAIIKGAGDFEGFEAVVSLVMPLGQLADFQRDMASGDTAVMVETIKRFGDSLLLSWNVEFDAKKAKAWNDAHAGATPVAPDDPVPANGDGLKSQGQELAMALIGGWSEALAAPPLTSSGLPTPSDTPESEASPLTGSPTSSSTSSASDTEAPQA
jgi:hypothetical protein